VIIWLRPFRKTKRVFYCKLVGGDRLKNANKIRSKIVAISDSRGNNRAKGATRLVNLRKTVEETRRRTGWKYLLKSSIIKDSILSKFLSKIC